MSRAIRGLDRTVIASSVATTLFVQSIGRLNHRGEELREADSVRGGVKAASRDEG